MVAMLPATALATAVTSSSAPPLSASAPAICTPVTPVCHCYPSPYVPVLSHTNLSYQHEQQC